MPLDTLPVLDLDPVAPPASPPPSTLPVLDLDPAPAAASPQQASPGTLPVLDLDPTPTAQIPLSSIYTPTTGAPGAESLGDIFGPPMPPPVTPPAPTATAEPPAFTDPMSGMPMAPLVNGPPAPLADTGEGFLGGLAPGFRDTLRNYARTFSGQAFTPDPEAPPQPTERTWLNQLGYGLGASPVVMGGGIAGGIMGAPAGPAGVIAGSGLGMGLPAAVEALGPSYQAARQQGMPHDEAVNYAVDKAVNTGSITAATAPLFALTPFKGLVGRLLYQSFVGMPAAGVATRVGVPAVMGEPLPSAGELATGFSHDVVSGLGFGLGHHLGTRAIEATRPATPPPPVPATSPVDAASTAAASTGEVYRTERPSEVYPVPEPPRPEQPVATAEFGPAPTRIDVTPTGPEGVRPSEPVPAAAAPAPLAAEAPATREGPPPSAPAVVSAPRLPAEEPLPARSVASEAEAGPPGAVVEPSRPPEPVIGEPVDRPGAAAGRPGEPAPVGETGAPGVEPRPGEVPGGPRLGTDLGERPSDTQGARPGEQPAAAAVPPEPPARAAAEAPTEQAAPVDISRLTPEELHAEVTRRGQASIAAEDAVAASTRGSPEERAASDAAGAAERAFAEVRRAYEQLPDREFIVTRRQGRQDHEATVTGKTQQEVLETEQRNAESYNRGVGQARQLTVTGVRPAAEAPATRPAETRLTTEPDHTVPGQHVAKNPAGEVVGKGASPEAATADAQRRSLTPYAEELPAARAPEDYRTLNPDIPATEYVRRLAELRDNKPRPIDKLWRNPETAPPEQVAAAREALRAWNQEYRQVARAQKLAEERDNAAYRARQEAPAPLEDQAVVLPEAGRAPGPREEAGTTGPRAETPAPVKADATLTKLQATRDALTNKVRTPAEERKLNTINQQIARREATLKKARAAEPLADQALAEDRRGGVKQPFSGPPKVGREPDFLDYKFNDGTSVYRSVLAEAGHNPDTATSLPIEKQVPILTSHMEKKFGFKSVTVIGPRGEAPSRVDLKIARDAMLDMTRATHDLMAVLGLPAEAASDHGNLRLVIDPTGKPGYFGSYVSDGTIHVVAGANSFGHEWMHAIDHLLAERFTNNPRNMNRLLTQYGRDSGLDVTDNVQAAMAKLINTMFYQDAALAARHLALSVDAAKVDKAGNPTKKALAAQDQLEKLEAGGSKLRIHASDFRQQAAAIRPGNPYFPSAMEMLARAGEAYMADKARASGIDPRGVVMPDEAYNNMVDRQLRMAYPKQDERTAIFAAFDDLFKAMQAESILDKGKPPITVSNYSISDRHYWPITAPAAASAGMTGLPGLVTREFNSYNNFTGRLRDALRLTDPNRPPPLPGQRWADRTKDFGRAALYSYGSMMKVIIARAPAEAKTILQPILDSLATAPGSGRYTPENFEEKVRVTSRDWTRQFGNMLEDAGFKMALSSIVQSRVGSNEAMTTEQGLMLRHGLVTGDTKMPDGTPIPANIQKLTGQVRQLLDVVWSHARDAGLDIGYAKNGFYPRIYDRYQAAADPAGFRKAAHELYSFMFDQELGAPGSDPQALLEKWTTMPRDTRALSTSNSLPVDMAELNRNLRRQREIEESPAPTAAETAELNQLKIDAEQLAIDAHDPLRDLIATTNANSWHANLTGGAMSDFDTGAPGGRFLQARVLPPEADQIMAAYMHTDPMVAIPSYLHSVARRAAYAKLFGANNERITEAIDKLNRIDGMSGDDVSKFFELVADVTGRNQRGAWVRFGQNAHNVVQGLGTLAMMERAVWSSLTEPVVAGLATGQMRAAFKNMGYTFGQLMRTADARDRTALAELLNVISSPQHDSVMLSRQGVDVNDQPQMGRLLSNFYRATFLTQVTNGQRAATVGTSNWFLGKLAQHILDTGTDPKAVHGRQDAARWLRELGLPDEIHQKFSQFMVDLQGKLPTPQMLGAGPGANALAGENAGMLSGMGDAYSLAVRRLTDRIIQDPYKVDRAMLTGKPILGLAYQLMSFNYSFQKNVLNPAGERLVHNFLRGRSEAMSGPQPVGQVRGALAGLAAHPGALAATVGAAFAMYAASLMTTIVRQYILAPDQWDTHQKKGDLWSYLKDLAFSRSGLNGVLDPLLQAWSHLKYDSDLMAVTHGASPNYYITALQKVLQPILGQGDPKTNTQLYNAAQGMFNLVGVPLMAYGLTAVSSVAGPIGKIGAGLALQGLTSPAASNRIATILAGPKGATRPEPAGAGDPGELPGMEGMDGLPGMDSGGAGAGGKDAAGGHALAAGPIMGIMDDVMVPAMRYLGPMISSLSPATKAAAGIAAGAYGAYEFLKAGAPFRGQPAPEPKKSTQQ